MVGARTLREELMGVFGKQMSISARIEKVQVETRHVVTIKNYLSSSVL